MPEKNYSLSTAQRGVINVAGSRLLCDEPGTLKGQTTVSFSAVIRCAPIRMLDDECLESADCIPATNLALEASNSKSAAPIIPGSKPAGFGGVHWCSGAEDKTRPVTRWFSGG
jgi:hypothetical protein